MKRIQIESLLSKADAARISAGNQDGTWLRGFCDALVLVLNYDEDDEATIDAAIDQWKV